MARVIRAGSVQLTASRIEAVDDAARIRRLAEEDAKRIRFEAREAGFAEARAEAAASLLETARLRHRLLQEAEASVIAVVRPVVERLLHLALEEDGARIVPLVRSHLERLQRAEFVEVRVHPGDALALHAVPLSSSPSVRVVPDETLQRGDVILESNLGRIDARLHVQLEALERALGKNA